MAITLPPIKSHSDTVVILAPGPSLTDFQVDLIRASGLFTVAVGDVGRVMLPTADVLYHCERKWWNFYKGCTEYRGLYRVALEDTNHEEVYQAPRSALSKGFDLTYPYLVTGNNSGYQAINLAVHFKPKRIILVGYDMKDAPDGRHNVIGDHPKEIKRNSSFPLFRDNIASLTKPLEELGITVYNCTIDTALKCFPLKELKNVL